MNEVIVVDEVEVVLEVEEEDEEGVEATAVPEEEPEGCLDPV